MKFSNKQSDFYQKIIKTLDSICDANEFGQLPGIERDLILEKLRNVYDQLVIPSDEVKKTEVPKEVEFEIEVEEKLNLLLVDEHIHETETEPEVIEYDELLSHTFEIKEKDVSPDPEPLETITTGVEEPDLFNIPENKNNPETISVIEKISEEIQKESIADHIQKKAKVENLMDAIGINEKFFFINELFDGNLNEYKAAIEQLDNLNSIDEMEQALKKLSEEYNWQGSHEAVTQLKQFVERKLM